jgi:DnaK suppressor protein
MLNKQLEEIKRKLMAERKCVMESLHRTTEYVLSEFDDTTRDSGDLASASHDKGLLYRLQESETKRLRAIDQVLSRIEADDYGTCERCSEAIGQARLEALPWATKCRPCQEEADLQNVSLPLSQARELNDERKRNVA